MTDVEPVYVDDVDNLALWHNATMYLLFEYGVERAGWRHCPQGSSWPKPACERCGCATVGPCWYCELKEAA